MWANGASLEQMYSTTEAELQGADLMFYAVEMDLANGVAGLAYVGTVCDSNKKYAESVNGWDRTNQQFGYVSHEILRVVIAH